MHPTYLLLLECQTAAQIVHHDNNNKAVNILFSGLGPVDFQCVGHLQTTRETWTTLAAHHEVTS